jgi:hypothetical protein
MLVSIFTCLGFVFFSSWRLHELRLIFVGLLVDLWKTVRAVLVDQDGESLTLICLWFC